MNITPIILAFNQPFLLPALTTILSTITHCSDLKRIEFFILHNELNPSVIALITRFIHSHGAFVTFINCRDAFAKINLVSYDPTRPLENYYPLLIPRYFATYKKCLFLDADLLVKDDILTMIDSMPSDKKLGVIRDTYHNHMPTAQEWGWHDYCRNTLHLENIENYFNSGVVLFNMSAITRDDRDACLKLIKNNWQSHDESILNHVFQNSLHIFSTRWNNNVESLQLPDTEFRSSFQKDLLEGRQDPAIYHFAGKAKPWRKPSHQQNLTCYQDYAAVWRQIKEELPSIAASILCGSLWDATFPGTG